MYNKYQLALYIKNNFTKFVVHVIGNECENHEIPIDKKYIRYYKKSKKTVIYLQFKKNILFNICKDSTVFTEVLSNDGVVMISTRKELFTDNGTYQIMKTTRIEIF